MSGTLTVYPATRGGLGQAIMPNTRWEGYEEGQVLAILLTFFQGCIFVSLVHARVRDFSHLCHFASLLVVP